MAGVRNRSIILWGAVVIGWTSIAGVFTLGGSSPTLTTAFYAALLVSTIIQVIILCRPAPRSRFMQITEWTVVTIAIIYLGFDLASFHHFAQRTSVQGVDVTLNAYNPNR